ncbi:serine protease grass-like [Eupeodes corollae]|uniref:serine protease grass-like n=1 Tax=Eupeodes corollae TaxID=290404 RepID=UPI00249163B5|nr:serine protease grass-like [Eupeodes corollae]
MAIMNSFLVVTLLVLLAVGSLNGQRSGGPCVTQRNDRGVCVPILTCGTITQLLNSSPRPLPASVSYLVRRSHCGTFNNVHHVCCEPRTVTGGEAIISPATTAAPPPPTSSTSSSSSNSIIRAGSEKSENEVRAGIAILERTTCGKSDADRVANGEDANLSEYPWMALIVYFDGISRTLDCGGTLIHERYVLTAAHCIRANSKRVVSVRLGEHDIDSTEDCTGAGTKRRCAPPIQEIDVEEAIYHKDYNPSRFSDDIGMLRLVRNVEIASNVKPICLPVTPASRQVNLNRMIISGWGRVESGVKANVLQKASVPIKTIDYCQQVHTVLRLTQKQLCAGGENEIDTCKGDSGGPLFYPAPYKKALRYIQYGIVSAGSVLCGSNYPGIYVRVEAYLPWIASNMISA